MKTSYDNFQAIRSNVKDSANEAKCLLREIEKKFLKVTIAFISITFFELKVTKLLN